MGEGFKFRVNGADVFAKGANWIPNDSFPGAITSESLRERLTQARNAGLNMLRVWGGGLYETEEFYNLCDELGLMVWQDFGFACAYYPDTGEYAEATRREASGAVRRIRNHPSLALWCGNNENQQLYQDNWADISPPRYVGEHLYNEILPSVVAAEDPSTSYWPASPYGGEDANSVDVGDCHNWDVWFLRGDWKHYVENGARFCSEFGFAASCGLPAWKTVLSESDYSVSSEAVRRHNKTRKEYETYLGYTELYFPKAHTLSDLVYFSQLNQAEALRCAVEHYRRHKGRCWGTLFWQFNDCWPVQSWSIVDYLGDPKAAYYAAKRFYSPVLLSLVHTEGGANAHLVNDLSHDLTGSLTFELRSFDGESLASRSMEISTGANSAACVADFNLLPAVGRERETYLFCEFQPRVGCNSGNILLQAKPKELCLKDPGLSVTVEESGKDGPIIIVRAQRFAPYTWLRRADDIPLMLSDNFFHLLPGETKRITTHSNPGLSANQLEDVIICRSLWHDCE
jgi:beta-mannosidase